jgi:hypothetical protein
VLIRRLLLVLIVIIGFSSCVPPPPPPPPPEPIVYNAVFDGAVTNRPPRLAEDKEVQVRFFIGAPNADNALDSVQPPNALILNGESAKTLLTVHMYCEFCRESRFQQDVITYVTADRGSTAAVFRILPEKSRILGGRGTIVFDVSSNGKELDNIPLHVAIGDGTPVQMTNREFPFNLPNGDGQSVDLIIGAHTESGEVILTFQPIHPKLQDSLRAYCCKTNQRFSSGTASAKEVQGTVIDVFTKLSALTAPFEDSIRKKLERGGSGVPRLDNLDRMEAEDGIALLNAITLRTRTLYQELFGNAKNVRDIMQIIEATTLDHPMRIRVETGDIAIPWQLLHPPGQLDPQKVWGFKYELSVLPLRERGGPIPDKGESGQSAFAVYGSEASDEVVYRLGRRLIEAFEEPGRKAQKVETKQAFLDLFGKSQKEVSLLVAFTHARSGVDMIVDSQKTVVGRSVEGPRLLFDPLDFVALTDLKDLINSRPLTDVSSQSFYFNRRPLVILDACESGSAASSNELGTGFPEYLLELGARGVITTEGPVPAYFGYFFGKELINRLADGSRFPQALHKTRLDLWSYNNPMGLLYGYYGSSDAVGL